MSQEITSPVLIVGAGPAGLSLALTLAQNGVPFRIIDKAQSFHKEQRGSGVQPRTQEVFHFLGVLSEMKSGVMGIDLQPLKFYKLPGGKDVLMTLHFLPPEEPTPARPFSNPIQVPQYHNEAIMRAHLAKYGITVELGTEIIGLEQFKDRVEATIKKTVDGKEEIETSSYRWLVGADGGKSVVRKQCGISFEGEATTEKAVLGEVIVPEGLDNEHWHMWVKSSNSDRNSLPMILMARATEIPGKYWFMLSGNVSPDEVTLSHESVRQALRFASDRDDLPWGEIVDVTDYRPSVRMVNNFREGRVFVAGDAAHVHTPRGGQGLNTSVQDVFNLAWKLALVEKGLASTSLLDTYSEERLPVIKHMLQETVRMTRGVLAENHDATTLKAAYQRGSHLKQFGINCRWSSIVHDERHASPDVEAEKLNAYGTKGDVVRAGDRAPNATGLVHLDRETEPQATELFSIFGPTHHTVIVFGPESSFVQQILESLKSYPPCTISSVVVCPRSASASLGTLDGADLILRDHEGVAFTEYSVPDKESSVVIVRPDGVVGAVVQGIPGISKYFSPIFSASST
ncbi:hypothetical protein FOMPIDRAFT_1060350 [Fomitopsis schrenkii]|uniref:FAD-binding domain-containing protein n=1 Tax=Fomitopsis schrenkii TaxID=2126942 RepID=S8FPW6_FOMSC|nr:hypothetical protein FOMPIDRAFT_1060350 [Fomitopsis schrenkii]